jgi:hypothetical protein
MELLRNSDFFLAIGAVFSLALMLFVFLTIEGGGELTKRKVFTFTLLSGLAAYCILKANYLQSIQP